MAVAGTPGSAGANPPASRSGRLAELAKDPESERTGGKLSRNERFTPGSTPRRGIGGSGWRGDAQWRNAVRQVDGGGTIRSIDGKVPTREEAIDLIKEAGGRVERIDAPHGPPNPHDFDHINYSTSSGTKGTLRILPEES